MLFLYVLAILFIIFLLCSNSRKESFAAGLNAVDAECINNCVDTCVENWPIYLRGPINDGVYMCSRWCEQHCAGCKNIPKCYSQRQLNKWIKKEKDS